MLYLTKYRYIDIYIYIYINMNNLLKPLLEVHERML